MTLSQKILDAARGELLRKYKQEEQEAFANGYAIGRDRYVFEQESALLAMEKQAEFFRSISSAGWVFLSGEWYQPHTDMSKAETELYEIFTTPQ